jgi:hypothetical protein
MVDVIRKGVETVGQVRAESLAAPSRQLEHAQAYVISRHATMGSRTTTTPAAAAPPAGLAASDEPAVAAASTIAA